MTARHTGRRSDGGRHAVGLAACLVSLAVTAVTAAAGEAAPGAPGGAALVLRADKALVCGPDHRVLDDACVVIEDGRISAIGAASAVEVPEGAQRVDLGRSWITPGLIDLHDHIAGSLGDINGAVYQSNPGLRVMTAVVPRNELLQRAVAGGVTSVLFIPGSATTIGGQGVLLKTAPERFEEMLLRQPGSLKLAQADNPKRWGWGMGRLTLNWQIREVLRRGKVYAQRWAAFEAGEGPEPLVEPQYEAFRDLLAGRAQISAHTQAYQVVYQTIRIAKMQLGLDVFIDHGTMTGFLAAELAEREGVPAILGPRSISAQNKGRQIDHDGKIVGVAAEYQQRGHTLIGFNTDAPVLPQEDLALQSAMGVRYGFDDAEMGTIRGMTIVPARVAGIDHRVGSLEVGKDADLVLWSGHPSDPRSAVERVWVEGDVVYDAREELGS